MAKIREFKNARSPTHRRGVQHAAASPDPGGVLYVRIDGDQKQRYDKLAEDLGVSSNKLVVMALDELYAKHNVADAIGVVTQTGDFVSRVGTTELSRTKDVAFPELFEVNNRQVQLVDVTALRQRLFEMDNRIAAIEAQNALTKSDVATVRERMEREWGPDWRKG